MKLKEVLKNFFNPKWEKVLLVFILEFCLTMTLLLFGDRFSRWQVYLLSPNVFYLETMINPLTITQFELSFHGAVANVIALTYLYFLSCLIIKIKDIIGRRR